MNTIVERVGYQWIIGILGAMIIFLWGLKVYLSKRDNKKLDVGKCRTIGDREMQNDSLEIVKKEDKILGVVCDGMGSGRSAKMCNIAVIKTFKELFEKNLTSNIQYYFNRAFNISHRMVRRYTGGKKGGCSTAAVIVHERTLYYASAGNCMIMVHRAGELISLVEPQTLGKSALNFYRRGMVTQQQAQLMVSKKELLNYVGSERFQGPNLYEVPIELQIGDTVMVATDGVIEGVNRRSIEMLLNQDISAQDAAYAIIERINRSTPGDRDNAGVLILKIQK